MVDWHRMEWQARANKWATALRLLLVLALAPEVYDVFKYHFPLWGDIAIPLTLVAHQCCRFIQGHTEMYRIDR